MNMKATKIELKNYRNYSSATLSLKDGLNVLMGKNAQGKTNLLESIFLCSIGKSIRTSKDKDLIKWGEEMAKVTLWFNKNNVNKKIEFFIFKNQSKAIKINGITIHRMGELMGEFNSVYFSPDELRLVKSSPDERRRYMDISLSQYDKRYFYALNKYNKILAQRNKLLKTGGKDISETVGIWNESLAKCGAYIINQRIAFVDKINVFAKNVHSYLTDNQENLEISYAGVMGKDIESIEKKLLSGLEESLEKDLNLGFTTVGPHRDDLKIISNNIDIRYFGSQGQQRTCALSLKLAELDFFNETFSTYPVLLLDDVLSELDKNRKEKLLKYVSKFQTILTTTEFEFDSPHSEYVVENGNIVK